ncbi:hypothetical protein FQN50_009644 [Emmonsiellopsis sp. PD_5]|nr:hypothetical protein FQN50_009644 [Emmonsiellopsis sp. PD_5]
MSQPSEKRRPPRKSVSSNEAWKKVVDTGRTLEILRCLRGIDLRLVAYAIALLKQVQSSSKRQKYQLFLHDVLSRCGPHVVLLCAIALGQTNVIAMGKGGRVTFVDELEKGRDQPPINRPIFRTLAQRHKVPDSVEEEVVQHQEQISSSELSERDEENATGVDEPESSSLASHRQPRQVADYERGYHARSDDTTTQSMAMQIQSHGRRGSNMEAERNSTSVSTCRTNARPTEMQKRPTHEGSASNLNTTSAQEVFEHASLEGIATVFDKYICDAIRRVPVQIDSITFWRASVTTVFPLWGGPVDCLLSLDICEWGVEYLAMALFNAKVKWAEQVHHIVLDQGTTLIVPNSEVTLKGVRDEAIIMVFGHEIHKAINESPVHRRELEEGKHVSECVSMILTKQGAIINLTVGLDRGLEIQNKLYT